MKKPPSPFNIRLLRLEESNLRVLKEVKVMDIFDGNSRNFHPTGLFSTETFGKVGSPERMTHFGYIDLYANVFHPVAFKAINNLKGLYGEIMSGKAYALWNPKLRDFERSDAMSGFTGFTYFEKYWKELDYGTRDSVPRQEEVKMLAKYGMANMIDKLLVIPAGYRDVEFDQYDRPTKDEINDIYVKVLAISQLMMNAVRSNSLAAADSSRYNLQLAVLAVYDYLKNIIEGKNKHVQGKTIARGVHDTTRNVITAATPLGRTPNDPRQLGPNETPVGMLQYIVNIRPIAYVNIRRKWVAECFPSNSGAAVLVNPKTLKREMVNVDAKVYDRWNTSEGLKKVVKRYKVAGLRHEPAMAGDYYLGLVYLDDRGDFKLLHGIDELPADRDKKWVRPMTVTDLLYVSLADTTRKYIGYVTRYPVINYGGIYPSITYLRTTEKVLRVCVLDNNWQRTDKVWHEYPTYQGTFYEAMSPSTYHLGRMGGDHDGDMTSLLVVMTKEANAEGFDKLNDPTYYVSADSRLYFNTGNDVLDSVVAYMAAGI